jgi:hypothetical protein
MRLLISCAALAGCLAGCTTGVEVISQTPVSIELRCRTLTGGCSPQELADKAQEHCRQRGQNAAEGAVSQTDSGSRWVTYRCVP